MTERPKDSHDADIRQRTWKLLQPGDIDLDGLVVHTDYDGEAESAMHRATVEVGDLIAEQAGHDPADTYVYSGTDDPEFASNQHQGRLLADDSFVWECQQLLRNGTFDVVFYFEAGADLSAILDGVRDRGHEVTGVRGAADSPASAEFEQ